MSEADLRVQVVGVRGPITEVEVEVELPADNLVRRVAARDEVVVYFPALPSAGLGVYVRAFDDGGALQKCVWHGGADPGDRVRVDLTTAHATCAPSESPDGGPEAGSTPERGDAEPGPPGRGPPDSSMGRGPDKRH